jgi:hypothetical protein
MAAGALLVGAALPAAAQQAQQPPKPPPVPNLTEAEDARLRQMLAPSTSPTVSFGGQMRVFGFAFDNMRDFRDSGTNNLDPGNVAACANSSAQPCRDSNSFYFQRFRLFTTIESADKRAKAYWALEIGDITWGAGGGASGPEYGGTSTRVGPSTGGETGNDGVNVETKNLYLQFNIPGIQNSTLLLGLHNIVFMTGPLGGFMDDDGAGIQWNWRLDPVDLQLYTVKAEEGNIANADDVDMYVARVGINATKDLRFTVEGMLIDQKNLPNTDWSDTFWIGGTVTAKVATVDLWGAVVYGQRRQPGVVAGTAFDQSGWGAFATARVPVGPLSVFGVGWYTSGDGTQPVGIQDGGRATLTGDSDKLPLPLAGASFFGGGGDYIAEWLFGNASIGAPGVGQVNYADPSGTYGIGGSVSYALTPAVNFGGGVAYVGASDQGSPAWGDNAFTLDAGINYRFNPNLVIQGRAGYVVPDTGDNAWGLAFRTQFSF